MSNLEQRIQQLEDIEAIRYLKHYYYCHCVDLCVAGDTEAAGRVMSRLADDVVLDFTGMPVMNGRQTVGKFLTVVVPDIIAWSQHRAINGAIDVEGDTASGIWYVDCPVVYREGKLPGLSGNCMVAGRYEENYRREDGIWKFTSINALIDVQETFDVNWSNASLRRSNDDSRETAED